jgi:hypothetical protein
LKSAKSIRSSPGSFRFLSGDPTEDVIEANTIELPHGEIGIFRPLQYQQNRIVLSQIGAGGSRESADRNGA